MRKFNQTDLEQELFRLYKWSGTEFGWWPKRLYQKFMPHCKRYVGGIKAVQGAIYKNYTGGFDLVDKKGRLDASLEALVLNPKWTHLFTDRDRAMAKKKLKQKSK